MRYLAGSSGQTRDDNVVDVRMADAVRAAVVSKEAITQRCGLTGANRVKPVACMSLSVS